MSYEIYTRVHSFTVTTTQTIEAQTIQNIIWDNSGNKIAAIRYIRELFKPICLKDAKEIYEAVEAEQR